MTEPAVSPATDDEIMIHLGPLAFLAGRWEGQDGRDIVPARGRST